MSTLVNISKQFGKNVVIDNISLDLTTHGITALVGPSGCGKSTLLRIAAGLLASDSGEVNTSLTHYGVVFQEPRLLPWLKVCENLALAFPIRDKSKAKN